MSRKYAAIIAFILSVVIALPIASNGAHGTSSSGRVAVNVGEQKNAVYVDSDDLKVMFNDTNEAITQIRKVTDDANQLSSKLVDVVAQLSRQDNGVDLRDVHTLHDRIIYLSLVRIKGSYFYYDGEYYQINGYGIKDTLKDDAGKLHGYELNLTTSLRVITPPQYSVPEVKGYNTAHTNIAVKSKGVLQSKLGGNRESFRIDTTDFVKLKNKVENRWTEVNAASERFSEYKKRIITILYLRGVNVSEYSGMSTDNIRNVQIISSIQQINHNRGIFCINQEEVNGCKFTVTQDNGTFVLRFYVK